MNDKTKKTDLSGLSLDELIAFKQRTAEIAAACREEIDAIRRLDGGLRDAKNVADHANTERKSLWGSVFAVAAKVYDATEKEPSIRYEAFTDALSEFLIPATGPDGKPLKLSTAGQYASTGRKLLMHCTDKHVNIAEYADKSREDAMADMRDKSQAKREEAAREASKRLRYIIKHGTEAERVALDTLITDVEKVWQPVKLRVDGKKAAAKGAKELADNRQQAPTEPATLETVAANIAGEGAEDGRKVAVG